MPAVLIVPIGLLLLLAMAYATPGMSHAWADALVRGFINFVLRIPLVGDVLAKRITDGASWIAAKVGDMFVRNAGRLINWVGGLGHYAKMIADATLDWPVELVSTVRWLLTHEIPKLIAALPNSITKLVHAAGMILGSLEKDVAKLWAQLPGTVKGIVRATVLGLLGPFWFLLRTLLHVWPKIEHAAAHAGGIAIPWIWVPRLRKDVRSLRKEFDKVKGILGVAAFAATLAAVLQVSRRCVRDGNIGKTARRLCGLDSSLLDSLLLDTLAIVGAISVVEFAKGLQEIEGEAVKILAAGITEFPGH